VLSPLVCILAFALALWRHCSYAEASPSARRWLNGQMMFHLVGPDRRRALAIPLMNWWRLRWRPDVLHIQGYTTTLLFAIEWAHGHGIPIVYEEHQTPDARFNWWRGFKESVNKADIVVAVSDTSAQALRDVCGITQTIVVRSPLLPDPVATGWRSPDKKHQDCDSDRLYCTTVARLTEAKGLTYLLDAIVQVKMTHPNASFRVYGEGGLRRELIAHADELGLDGESIFVGPFTSHEELAGIMDQTDVFVLSSILEGQPLAVVEAMSYGRPIVSTSVGGIPELIVNGSNGLLCAPANSKELAEKICLLLDDPDLRDRLGEAARETYVAAPFQPAALCRHFNEIYRQAQRMDARSRTNGQDLVPDVS
jgi:glycosyltransferase involved in cell wall biosynthesis